MNPHDTVTKQEFLDSLFSQWHPEIRTEQVPVEKARGRVLAETQYAQFNLPVYRASRMDGIAVRSSDFRDGPPDTSGWIPGRDYVRADTGDDFDDAFDAVIMIEYVELHPDGSLTLNLKPDQQILPGTCVSPAGSRLAKGAPAAYRGQTINAVTQSSLVIGGLTRVPVIKKPSVGYIPTGSELIPAGTVPMRGQNIDSNSILVKGLLERFGAEPVIYDIVPDSREQLAEALDRAIRENDVVLMSGGSSKGEEDYTTRLFEERGTLLSHWVKAVPGRPMSVAFDQKTGTPLINLSGPPAACLNGMIWCVNPVISRMTGRKAYVFPEERAVLDEDLHGADILEVFHTLLLHREPDGILRASFTNRSLACNGFYISSAGEEFVPAGDSISVSLFCPPGDY